MVTIKSTTVGGDFSNPATWIGGVVPAPSDTVILAGPLTISDSREVSGGGSITADNGEGHTPRYNDSASLTITDAAELDILDGGRVSLVPAGGIAVNGSIWLNGGELETTRWSGGHLVISAGGVMLVGGNALLVNASAITWTVPQSVLLGSGASGQYDTVRLRMTDVPQFSVIEHVPLAIRLRAGTKTSGSIEPCGFATHDASGQVALPDSIPAVAVYRNALVTDGRSGLDSNAVVVLAGLDAGRFQFAFGTGDPGDSGRVVIYYSISGQWFTQTFLFVTDAAVSDVTGQTSRLHFDADNNLKSVLAPAGLDAIGTAAPIGTAGTFREMMVQLWRRFFRKATKDQQTLKTYADDGTTVLTTQPVSDDGITEVQGTAE